MDHDLEESAKGEKGLRPEYNFGYAVTRIIEPLTLAFWN
jgi:hypothetical protein